MRGEIIKKLYIDFDGTIANSIAAICNMYNEDFKYYEGFEPVKWWEVNSWDFEECKCASREYIDIYFTHPRFFTKLTYMDWAKEILNELKQEYEITIVSSGVVPNLRAKEDWIKENLPYCKFIGVNLKEHCDKSHIDMSDGIFIDDVSANLKSSNALVNICFGEIYKWNEDWCGFRCNNWNDVKKFLKGEENK